MISLKRTFDQMHERRMERKIKEKPFVASFFVSKIFFKIRHFFGIFEIFEYIICYLMKSKKNHQLFNQKWLLSNDQYRDQPTTVKKKVSRWPGWSQRLRYPNCPECDF
jgi:Tol biopolymer transport system component